MTPLELVGEGLSSMGLPRLVKFENSAFSAFTRQIGIKEGIMKDQCYKLSSF